MRSESRIMDKYGGSGYDAAQEIIDCWSLRLTAEPEFEERFQQWCIEQDIIWRQNRAAQLRALARTIEEG
eukprot:12919926-Alexandrium_andersonii.AAC.1